jgi:hypothetical protein
LNFLLLNVTFYAAMYLDFLLEQAIVKVTTITALALMFFLVILDYLPKRRKILSIHDCLKIMSETRWKNLEQIIAELSRKHATRIIYEDIHKHLIYLEMEEFIESRLISGIIDDTGLLRHIDKCEFRRKRLDAHDLPSSTPREVVYA